MNENRNTLELETRRLINLAQQVSGLTIDRDSKSPREFNLQFSLRSFADYDPSNRRWVETDSQEVQLIVPVSFPKDPPQIRWTTPIFHPNVSVSGYLDCNDIGLHWSDQMSLSLLVERLWDIARFAWMDPEIANHYSAKRQWESDPQPTPTDLRTISDEPEIPLNNIVNYRTTGAGPQTIGPVLEQKGNDSTVHSITDSGPGGSKGNVRRGEDSTSTSTSTSGQSELGVVPRAESDSPATTDLETVDVEIVESKTAKPDTMESSPVIIIDENSSPRPPVIRADDDEIMIIE